MVPLPCTVPVTDLTSTCSLPIAPVLSDRDMNALGPVFNAVYPYLYGTTDLNINKVGFIIIQMKNDPDVLLDQVFRKDESLLDMDDQ